ncbi:MAG: hypothetical protein JSV45_15305 [Chromatiales bacterium]|nr:MAG: hypothetical protein JSV45_15305 [Chromatiales bacterium]
MNNKLIKAFVFALCLAAGNTAQAFVGGIAVGLGQMNEEVGDVETSFAADATLETEEMTANTRIYYQPGMVRDEMDVGGQQMVTIRRFDLQKVWTIMGQGMYMENEAAEGSQQSPEYRLISRELIGPEIVNGMATIKYKSVYESKDGKFGGFTWFTDDNIAVKGFMIHETKGEKQRFKFEFTSLDRGPQEDSLFEIPPGYQKFDMRGFAGMQGMGQGGSAGGYGAPPSGAASPPTGTAAPPPAPASAEGSADGGAEDDSLAGVVVDEAKQSAEDSARQETRRGVRESISKGFGKIFGR